MQKLNRTTPALSLIIFVIGCALTTTSPALAQYSSPVRVLNTSAQPVPVKTQIPLPLVFYSTTLNFSSSYDAVVTFTSPTGNRLVIDLISFHARVPTNARAYAMIEYVSNGVHAWHTLVLQNWGADDGVTDLWLATLPVQIVIDSNTLIYVRLYSSVLNSKTGSIVCMTGYQLPN